MNKMNKKNIAVKIIILAVAVVLFCVAKGASAAENRAPVFQNISDSTIECFQPFSVLKNRDRQIQAFNFDGKLLNYSVYYRGKKVNTTDNYINRAKVGTHVLRYEVKGTDGQVTNTYRTIKVVDKTPPVFKNISDSTISINSKFSVKKNGNKVITATDRVNGSRGYSVYYKGKKISSKNYINTKKVTNNKYHLLRYEAKDKSGNTRNVYRKIYVINPNKPYFTNLSNSTIAYNSKFSVLKNKNKSIKAYCKGQGQIKYSVYLRGKKVSKTNYINTKKSGKYTLKYIAKNSSDKTTIKYRTITVRAKVVKTSKKVATKQASNVVRISPRRDDERGFWYQGLDKSRIFVHSGRGENLRNINVGTTVYISEVPYKCYDKFLMWAPYPLYVKSSYSKQFHFVGRGGKDAGRYISQAEMYMQTCYDFGNSQVLICLLKPTTNKTFGTKVSPFQVSAPQ